MARRGQRDSGRLHEKVAVREAALVGLPERHVVDFCHGGGEVWARIPHDSLLALDAAPRGPGTLKMKVDRAIRELDLAGHNVFDLDAYGCGLPWAWTLLDVLREGAPREVVIAVTWGFFSASMRAPGAVWRWLGWHDEQPACGILTEEIHHHIGIDGLRWGWAPDSLFWWGDSRRWYGAARGNTSSIFLPETLAKRVLTGV